MPIVDTPKSKAMPIEPLREIAELADAIASVYPMADVEFQSRLDELTRAEADLPKAIDDGDAERLQLRINHKSEDCLRQMALCKAWWSKVETLAAMLHLHMPEMTLWYVGQAEPWHATKKIDWAGAIDELRMIVTTVREAKIGSADNGTPKEADKPSVKQCWFDAWNSFTRAVNSRCLPKPLKSVHEWLKHFDEGDYELPDLKTWTKYLRAYKHAMGNTGSSPRSGRTGRSVLPKNEV